jgi:MFS family permease
MAFYGMSKALRITAMGWYIYDVTNDPIYLGYLALSESLAYIITNPIGGYLADRFGAKRQTYYIVILTFILTVCLCVLLAQPASGFNLLLIFVVSIFFGLVRGLFGSGALPTLIALAVPREKFQKATALNGSLNQAGQLLGPIIGGILYALYGPVVANGTVLVFMLFCLICVFNIEDIRTEGQTKGQNFWQDLTLGFRYIFSHDIFRTTVLLDFVAVVFSGVTGLLPVFAKDILHLGPDGLGFLRSSIQVGSIIAGLYLAHYPIRGFVGRQYVRAVLLFCLMLLLFAFSTSYYLSMFLLFLSGFFDWYGSVIRQTISRLLSPEELLGRITSARVMFVVSSNEVSTFESGLVAGLIGAIPSVVFGVAVTVAFTGLMWFKTPKLKYINMDDLVNGRQGLDSSVQAWQK